MTTRYEAFRYLQDVVLPYEGDECLSWPFSKGKTGYCQISIDRKKHYVHRLVCTGTNGPPPSPEHQAAHSCGNRSCVNAGHLSWKTQVENEADKITHGTSLAKLNERDVIAIRASRGRVTQDGLSKLYGVSQGAISDIQRGRRWAWLE